MYAGWGVSFDGEYSLKNKINGLGYFCVLFVDVWSNNCYHVL